jgi:sugar lactone lactonase YvrE
MKRKFTFKLLNTALAASLLFGFSNSYAKKPAPHTGAPILQSTLSNVAGIESVVFDAKRNRYFASLQAGDKVGDGSIVVISADGTTVEKTIATGLDDPKGITIVKDQLSVGDLTKLVQIDLNTGAITKHEPENAQFLNDTVADSQGRVYVSDMFTSAIYRLENGKVSLWMQSPELENPNGLLFVKNDLYVAAWGAFQDGKPINAPHGRLLKVNPKTKSITKVTTETFGNLDGLQLDDKGNFLVSDWKQSAVFSVTPKGVVTKILDLPRGAGDILYQPKQKSLLIPMARDGQLRRYTW